MSEPKNDKMWGGRFERGPDAGFYAFERSWRFDRRLLPYELALDRAWARGLQSAQLLSAGESAQGSLLVGGDVTTPGVFSPGGVPGQRRMVWMPRKLLSVPGVAQLAS